MHVATVVVVGFPGFVVMGLLFFGKFSFHAKQKRSVNVVGCSVMLFSLYTYMIYPACLFMFFLLVVHLSGLLLSEFS